MLTSREIRLKSRPVGMPSAENFELAVVPVPDPAPGEVQVKNLWMTVDPYMRGRMIDRPSYIPPFQLGQALQGGAIGEVTASDDPGVRARRSGLEHVGLARGVQRAGGRLAAAEHVRAAAAGVPRRCRHAGTDRTHGPQGHRRR